VDRSIKLKVATAAALLAVKYYAFGRTDRHALLLIKTFTLSTQLGIDNKDIITFGNSVAGTFRLAGCTADAFIGNFYCHFFPLIILGFLNVIVGYCRKITSLSTAKNRGSAKTCQAIRMEFSIVE
jgi:hypothetical protein